MKLLNEILGTKYPIIQGGMANIATGEFAAACSNAGALGLIGAGGMNAEILRENIRRCKELTDKPFGVNIMLMHPQVKELAQVAAEEHVGFITTGAGNPAPFLPLWKEAGAKVFPVVAAVALAKLAAKAGAGSLVPITGFANAVVSAAIEFKTEGRVLGTGAKMFTIAGPVIVYGTLAAVVYGAALWLLGAA